MKVREVLKHIYFLDYVVINQGCGPEEPEILYKGTAFDIPWWIADMELDTDENGEAISVGIDKFRNDTEAQPCFIIYVKESA